MWPWNDNTDWNPLRRIERKLDQCIALVTKYGEKIMAVADDIKAALTQLDTETNAVASNIQALAAKIHNSMTDQEVADIKASFGTLGTRLTSLAVDPTVPVPPPPAPLQQLRKKLS